MTDKAYIVANEEQEREILNKFIEMGIKWGSDDEINEFIPSHVYSNNFPYALIERMAGYLNFCIPLHENSLFDMDIVYDGRKESKMKVDEKVYKALDNWKDAYDFPEHRLTGHEINDLPVLVDARWKTNDKLSVKEKNERLLAIIQFAMGEQPFEIEKPKKWVVRSKKIVAGSETFVSVNQVDDTMTTAFSKLSATKFDTKEEAESWANAHQEVIEVEAEA